MTLIGEEERLATDERLRDITARTEHATAVYAFLGEAMRQRTTAEWLEALTNADIPAAPMHTLDSLVNDPHLGTVGFFEMVEHPSEGRIRQMGIAGRWSEAQPRIRRHAPRLGEHSVEILREAGLDDEQIQAMLNSNVTAQANP